MMADIGRNRKTLAAIAAVAIIIGLLLVGGVPKAPSPPAPAAKTASNVVEADKGPSEQFLVPDYSQFTTGPDADLPSSDWLGLLAGMIVKLALVIGLIYLAIKALRSYVYKGQGAFAAKKPVSLLGSLNLSPNKTVYVLEVGRKILVVGGTQNQLSLLTEIQDQEAIDEVRSLSAVNPAADQFSSFLNAARQQFSTRETPPQDAPIHSALQMKVDEGRAFLQSKIAGVRPSAKED